MRRWFILYNVKIKDLPPLERPMERLIEKGAEALGTDELIAILLQTGNKQKSAKGLAEEILKEVGGIHNLENISYELLLKIKGIGERKASTLMALTELSKRMHQELETLQGVLLNNTSLVFRYYKDRIGHKKQEYFYTIYLNTRKRVLKEKLLFIGTLSYSMVHPREIFKEALLLDATSVICVHNHPSGHVIPSKEDLTITKKLSEVGALLGIPIVDHIIIGKNKYYSFYENEGI